MMDSMQSDIGGPWNAVEMYCLQKVADSSYFILPVLETKC